MDLCMWGAGGPGSLLAYNKLMRLASYVGLTPLIRTCNRQQLHQVVEGSVRSGVRKCTRRSTNSREYTMDYVKNG